MRTIRTTNDKILFVRLVFNKKVECRSIKKTFITCFLFFLLSGLSADPGLTEGSKRNWILDKSIDNVDFYYSITTCNGESVVFLKFDNKNTYDVKISWEESFITTQVKEKRNGFNGVKNLVLHRGITAQEDCENIRYKECFILPVQVNPAYKPIVEVFEYKSIQVILN